ncbi:MAG: alanine--glyoxylate aminotransferase family protein [Rubrivivax sp.]
MPGLCPDVDPDGLLEYSVVYTDRALNHMSRRFQQVMRDVSGTLKEVHGAAVAIVLPGSGSFAMEAVARQFAHGKRCLVVRNGWFSYRWSQILEMGAIPSDTVVLTARRVADAPKAAFAPPPADEVAATIRETRPALVFAPHVETSAGLLLPDAYLRTLAEATHAVGGLLVLDGIASGAVWTDLAATGVDVLVSAPQKVWSAPPGAGLVMLSPLALERLEGTTSSSFAMDLKKWHSIMQSYEGGGFAYHATPPTHALLQLRNAMDELRQFGFGAAREAQFELGRRVRALLADRGLKSVAAPGFEAPGVVVTYTDDPEWHSGKAFAAQGLQIAAGVPLACGEPSDFRSFRIGLFGIDKLQHVDRTVASLKRALDALG